MREGFVCSQDRLFCATVAKLQVMALTCHEKADLTAGEFEELTLNVTSAWCPSVRLILENQLMGETATLAMSSIKSDFGIWEPREYHTHRSYGPSHGCC